MPHDGSLDLPESIQGLHKRRLEPSDSRQEPQEEGGSANEEGLEAVDGPAKRTRAQVSLAELTMEELEMFLQVRFALLQSFWSRLTRLCLVVHFLNRSELKEMETVCTEAVWLCYSCFFRMESSGTVSTSLK